MVIRHLKLKKHLRKFRHQSKRVKTLSSVFNNVTDSQGLPVAHTVRPWDVFKQMRANPNHAVIHLTHFEERVITDPWYVLLLGSKGWPGLSKWEYIKQHLQQCLQTYSYFKKLQSLLFFAFVGGYLSVKATLCRFFSCLKMINRFLRFVDL